MKNLRFYTIACYLPINLHPMLTLRYRKSRDNLSLSDAFFENPIYCWWSATGADPGIYFGGGQTKVPNRKLRAKPESRARSARVSRAKPESRARSARELRAKPEPRAKPEKNRGRGLGRGLGEPLPRKFLKNQTWNQSFWCIFEAIIWND